MLSVERILTFLFATHANILTSLMSTVPYFIFSTSCDCSFTSFALLRASIASVSYFSPGYLRRKISRPVCYYPLCK